MTGPSVGSLAREAPVVRLIESGCLTFWVCFISAVICSPANALDPSRQVSQYAHTAWRTQDGLFNGSPIVITQTTDGYLWIGTNLGLIRFDGVHFASWSPPTGSRLLDSRIFSLIGARDGSLWIGTGYSVSHWKDGGLVNYPQITGRVEALVEDDEGAIWLVRTQMTDQMGTLCRVKDDRFQCYGPKDGVPFPLAIRLEKGSAGQLWVGGYTELCRWKAGSSRTYFSNETRHPETFASLRGIATGPDGAIWAAIDRPGASLQLEKFEHETWTTHAFPGIHVNNSDIATIFVDRDNVLWIGTALHGVFRVQGENVDHFGSTDGLSSDAVGRFYQDAEGTLWVVTSEGIDNLRDLQVVSYSMREGLSAAGASSVIASRDGTVWVGNFQALDFLRNGKLSAIRSGHGLPGKNVTTLFEDHVGRLWLGVDSGLWVYDGATFRAIRRANGDALGIIFAITEDVHHSIWVRAGTNLVRISELKVQDQITSPQIASAYTLSANPRGGIVMGLVNGDLLEMEDGKTQTIATAEVENTRQIRNVMAEPDGSVWGVTLDEVARWKDGVRKNLSMRNGLPCDGIFDLAKDRQGSLWLYARCGIITIEKSELDDWWQHPDDLVKSTLFDTFEGVQPGLTSLKPQAAQSPDGRLWFVNGRTLQMLDPEHLPKNLIPPPVQVEGVIADRRSYSLRKDLRLPPLTRDLEIDYTALSFMVPQKVRFRYKLEGRDAAWQEPGTRRQAFYTDLRPGKYQFHVIASNNDGVWNEVGATLEFSVAPTWYQNSLFRVLSAVVLMLLLWALYQLRLHQLAQQFNMTLEARVGERTRIARELHDTLLQSFHGLMFRFQAARNMLPGRPEEAMHALDGAIDRAEQAITESRNTIQGLRSEPAAQRDLAELLSAMAKELAAQHVHTNAPAFEVIVEGERRSLSPAFQEEVCSIARELLRNAFQHAHANHIEAEIRYDHPWFRLRIRDDGEGIDPTILKEGGRSGHWGLPGVRERAQRIGAQLDFWSNAGAGTEVQLMVAGSVAYQTPGDGAGSPRKARSHEDRS
jgi:signal transduction histidine kinase/ligand-binding sensor domain-containing protein